MKTRISELLESVSGRLIKGGGLAVLMLLAMFVSVAPAQAQSPNSDTWKSVAIIGGSTAAGAVLGHAVAGRTGAWIGAAAGGATGYAIDHRRRQNEYKNEYGYNGPYPNNGGYYGNGSYPNNGQYYPSNAPYYPNGGYSGPGNAYPNGPVYQNTGYYPNPGYYPNSNGRCSRR